MIGRNRAAERAASRAEKRAEDASLRCLAGRGSRPASGEQGPSRFAGIGLGHGVHDNVQGRVL